MTISFNLQNLDGLRNKSTAIHEVPVRSPVRIYNFLELFAKIRRVVLRRRAERNFARGNNESGVACLLAMGSGADAAAAFRLGECYEHGLGAVQNFVEAVFWFERAAERGSVPAMEKLGDIYLSGRIIPISGRPVSASTADQAMLGSNDLRPKGMSVPRDLAKALDRNTKAAEAGAPEAQARLGFQYIAGLGIPEDHAMAHKWFLASAEQECASGQFGMGILSVGGLLGDAETAKASAWFQKAAAQGNANAKHSLALLLTDEGSDPVDWARGARLFSELAAINQTEAMFHLGRLYQKGRGVVQNTRTAETWFRRAGTRGHVPSLLALARVLIEETSPPDYESAGAILGQAAELGDPHAQYALAQLYAAGRGVPLDPEMAGALFRKAEQALGVSLSS